MRKVLILVVLVALLIPVGMVSAHGEGDCSGIAVIDGRVRSSVGPTGAAYALIVNLTEESVTLTGGSAEIAEAVEIHSMTMGEGDVMQMNPVEGGLVIPPGHAAQLQPGGLHVMMINLSDMLMAGDTLDLTLTFADLGDFTFTLPIMDIETGMDHGDMDMGHQEDDDHAEEGEHPEGEEHGEGMDDGHMDMGDHSEYVKSVAVVGGECEGVTQVMVMPHADMENVVDLVFVFEEGDEWSVSVPVISSLDEMEEMDSGGNA
jgi:hypothetical protein